ncbi:COG4 transport protein-domain-containing protein [Cladochytrium replicatum]|nr:COG4 transport protein-domain-containing protein [Cladochytrium replicatum]KAI8814518.1 COG4 transport protein-domain-containing protein [Cladochytrium replicatum]
MGKRKAKRKVEKKVKEKLAREFNLTSPIRPESCSVEIAPLDTRLPLMLDIYFCGLEKNGTKALSEAVDVYHEWIDACERVNKAQGGRPGGGGGGGGSHRDEELDEDEEEALLRNRKVRKRRGAIDLNCEDLAWVGTLMADSELGDVIRRVVQEQELERSSQVAALAIADAQTDIVRRAAQREADRLAEEERTRRVLEQLQIEVDEIEDRRRAVEAVNRAEDEEQQRRVMEEMQTHASMELIRRKSIQQVVLLEEMEQERRKLSKSFENLPEAQKSLKKQVEKKSVDCLNPLANTTKPRCICVSEVVRVAESLALEKLMLLADIEDIYDQFFLLNNEETRIYRSRRGSRQQCGRRKESGAAGHHKTAAEQTKVRIWRNELKTTHLAEKISVKVRQLDLHQSRVKDTVNLVEEVRDLQRCALRVNQAMENEDWEEAGAQIKRFLEFDQTLLDSLFSGDGKDSYFVGGGNASGVDTLTATSSPVGVLRAARRRFIEIAVERFDRATDNGGDEEVASIFKLFPLVGEYDGLDKLAGFVSQAMYADLLTRLFETVANAIARQQPIVEAHYGAGKIVRFMARLQKEADIQSSIIIDEFLEKRQLHESSNHLDPRELDVVLTEMSIMSHRAALYERFFRIKLELESAKTPNTPLDDPYMESRLRRRVTDIMADYVQLEEWFFRKSIENLTPSYQYSLRAVKIDHYEPGSRTSSCVDDVFYILRTSTTRALSTSNADSLCALVGSIGRSLEVDYMYGFQKRLTNSVEAATEGPKETKLNFHENLTQELEAGALQMRGEESELIVEKIQVSIQGLKEHGSSFRSSVNRWIKNLFNQLIKPRIRPLLQEATKDVRYALSEDECNAEAGDGGLSTWQDSWAFNTLVLIKLKTMIYALEYLARDWERYVFSNFKSTQRTKECLPLLWELGALRFDKDVRDVTSHSTSETSWPTARDKFARMNQIATLLNIDSVSEVNEFVSSKTGDVDADRK